MSGFFEMAPAALTRSLAVAGLLAAACLGTSTASAADCVNGYRTIGNDVILLCDESAGALGSNALFRAAPENATPAVTGALPFPAARPATGNLMADGPQDCRPGQYRIIQQAENSGDTILAC